MKKKIFAMLVAVATVGGAIPAGATTITNRAQLAVIAFDLAGTYVLESDIDLLDIDWAPLGNDKEPFTGTFYGNGHAIRNLVCTNNPSGNNNRGLFGCASNATIESVSVSGVVAGKQYVGGLVGRARGEMVIRDCSTAVEITATGSYAGGLIGSCDGGSATSLITGCRADGFVGGNGYVGGLIGYVYVPATVSNCVARGDVCSSGSDFGGFIGRFAHASATIDDCWSSGAVWGTGGNIGSFVGNRQSGTITNCAVSAYANGLRLFCGNTTAITGGRLTQAEIKARSANWPSAPKRANSASMTPIATVEDFLAITNDLAGCYVLVADIDFGGATIKPIGDFNTAFTGEFYGQRHRISGFIVATTDRYAGLFGKIAGGRVSGVQAEGEVTSSYEGSGSDVGVGGFAGKIDSKSLVEGCSFDGTVASEGSSNVGGFVGYTVDSPVILRCCVHCQVANGFDKPNTGGFIGHHYNGSVMDCYAESEVESEGSYVGGFAGYVASAAKIATSWCSGMVDSQENYIGAFVGQANGNGRITDSYYDTSANGQMMATGSGRGSAAYVGVTPLDGDGMTQKSNFANFDFDSTWNIDEMSSSPYLRAFEKNAYEVWLGDAGLPWYTAPGADVNGIPAGVRYVFDIPAEATDINALPGEPFFHVTADGDGYPCVKFRAKRDPCEGVVVSATVCATTDLLDMGNPDPADWPHRVALRYDAPTDTYQPADGSHPPTMFFTWRLAVASPVD